MPEASLRLAFQRGVLYNTTGGKRNFCNLHSSCRHAELRLNLITTEAPDLDYTLRWQKEAGLFGPTSVFHFCISSSLLVGLPKQFVPKVDSSLDNDSIIPMNYVSSMGRFIHLRQIPLSEDCKNHGKRFFFWGGGYQQ